MTDKRIAQIKRKINSLENCKPTRLAMQYQTADRIKRLKRELSGGER